MGVLIADGAILSGYSKKRNNVTKERTKSNPDQSLDIRDKLWNQNAMKQSTKLHNCLLFTWFICTMIPKSTESDSFLANVHKKMPVQKLYRASGTASDMKSQTFYWRV